MSRWFLWLFAYPLLGLAEFMMLVLAWDEPKAVHLTLALSGPVAIICYKLWVAVLQRRQADRLLIADRPDFELGIRQDGIRFDLNQLSTAIPWNNVSAWSRHGNVIKIETQSVPLFVPTSALPDAFVNTLEARLTDATNLSAIHVSADTPSPAGPHTHRRRVHVRAALSGTAICPQAPQSAARH